jgi:hypothetical protein
LRDGSLGPGCSGRGDRKAGASSAKKVVIAYPHTPVGANQIESDLDPHSTWQTSK